MSLKMLSSRACVACAYLLGSALLATCRRPDQSSFFLANQHRGQSNSTAFVEAAESTGKRRGSWPAYVISFPKDTESRERLQAPLSQVFSEVKHHNAVDGKKLSYSDMVSKSQLMNPMLSGRAVGCYLSHQGVWEDHVKNSKEGEWAAVFEADAILHPDFHEIIEKLQNPEKSSLLQSGRADQQPADIIFLGHCFDQCSATDAAAKDDHELKEGIRDTRGSGRPQCTHGYMLSHHGAKRLVESTYPIVTPLDDGPMWELNSRIVCPQVVRQPWQEWDDRQSAWRGFLPVAGSKLMQMTYKAMRMLR